MSDTKEVLIAHLQQSDQRIQVPASVFSSAAEGLRFDAFRFGQLHREEWRGVQATVAPSWASDANHERQFNFVVSLHNARHEIRRQWRPEQLQRLQLYLARHLAVDSVPAAAVTYQWPRARALAVPLVPFVLPFDEASAPPRNGRPPRLALIVQDEARQQLAAICRESLRDGVELGGCLVGRATIDALVLESVVRAPDNGGSAAAFTFNPRFWIDAERSRAAGQRLIGWLHSHLCDDGHPHGLSERDQMTAYLHFSAPWLLTAVVCATREIPDVRWYGWESGALVEREDRTPLA